jgi:hypothetical protein
VGALKRLILLVFEPGGEQSSERACQLRSAFVLKLIHLTVLQRHRRIEQGVLGRFDQGYFYMNGQVDGDEGIWRIA